MLLADKNILLEIGGSISAYKAPELVRMMRQNGAAVQTMLSSAAEHFVTPLTLSAVSGQSVFRNMFGTDEAMTHIHASRKADIVVIAPATANMLAKFAYGMADDLISSTVLASNVPVLIAPAMNVQMWRNPIVQENAAKLRAAGYDIMEPDSGSLACGETGEGRLPDLQFIVYEIVKKLTPKDLEGKKVVVTAGPTREYADPVRFLSNPSSGKMGYALAREAYYRGANVVVVSGAEPSSLPRGIQNISVVSARDMEAAALKEARTADIFIGSAAVSDYRFSSYQPKKIKKNSAMLRPEFIKNEDILQKVSDLRRPPYLVGFAMETDRKVSNARLKMKEKKLNLMILNDQTAFAGEEAEVRFVTARQMETFEKMSKEVIAKNIFNRVVKSFRKKR